MKKQIAMKKETKNNRKIKMIFLAGIIILAAVVLLTLNFNQISNQSDEQFEELSPDDFYSEDSCRCLEKNLPSCLSDFEYNETRKLCVNSAEKKVTYATFKCSKYECSGITYSFNFEEKIWEENK